MGFGSGGFGGVGISGNLGLASPQDEYPLTFVCPVPVSDADMTCDNSSADAELACTGG